MGAFYGTHYAAQGTFFPYLNLYLHTRGWSGTQIGVVAGIGPVIGVLARPVWGYAADRLNKKREVLAFLSVAIASAVWLYPWSSDFAGLVFASVMTVLFQTAVAPIADGVALDILEGRSHEWGRLRLWGSLAFAVLSWLSGFFYSRVGLGAMFPTYATLTICAAGSALLLPTGIGGKAVMSALSTDIGDILRTPGFLRFVVSILLWQAANTSASVFLGIFLGSLGAPTWTVGAVWALLAIVEGAVLRVSPKMVYRFGLQWLLMSAAAVQALRLLMLGLSKNPVWVLVAQGVGGIAMAAYLSGTVLYVNSVFPPQWRATGQSILAAAGAGLGSLLGSVASGYMMDTFGMRGMYGTTAGIAVLSLVLLLRLPTKGTEGQGECTDG